MKVIGWIIGLLLVLIVGVGVLLVLNAGNVVKTAVETLGPRYLGVPVRLSAADISVTEGSGELRGLEIGNPAGFQGPYAIRINRASVTLDPSQISGSLIVLKAFDVDGADVAIAAKGRNTNLQAIMKNLESGSTEAPAPAEESGAEVKMIIDRFDFTNARASLDSDLVGSKEVSIPDIHLTGIGRKSEGVTIREAAKQVLRPIVQRATEVLVQEGIGVDQLKEQANQKLQEEIGSGLERLKKSLPQ
jgi:hypothetical protein